MASNQLHDTKRQKGAAFVDVALILSVFIFVFMGIVDFAQIMHTQQSLVERARNAARVGAVAGLSNDAIRNLIMYQTTSATGGTGAFGLTASNISIDRLNAGTAEQRLVVKIQNLDYKSFSPLINRVFKNMPVTVVLSSESANDIAAGN